MADRLDADVLQHRELLRELLASGSESILVLSRHQEPPKGKLGLRPGDKKGWTLRAPRPDGNPVTLFDNRTPDRSNEVDLKAKHVEDMLGLPGKQYVQLLKGWGLTFVRDPEKVWRISEKVLVAHLRPELTDALASIARFTG